MSPLPKSSSICTPMSISTTKSNKASRSSGIEGIQKNRRNSKPPNRQIAMSKKLSYTLRHGAHKDGIAIGGDGFVKLTDLQKHPKFGGLTLEILKDVVSLDNKNRYKIEYRNNEVLVRANQGHSLKEVSDLELVPITSADACPVCVHGTYTKAWHLIKDTGLKTMNRNHVHCARGLPGDDGVISGMRQSCEVFIYINVAKTLEDGMKWFSSTNNVLLTDGFDGLIPVVYFASVVTREGAQLL
eukprot:CFRG0608T1